MWNLLGSEIDEVPHSCVRDGQVDRPVHHVEADEEDREENS